MLWVDELYDIVCLDLFGASEAGERHASEYIREHEENNSNRACDRNEHGEPEIHRNNGEDVEDEEADAEHVEQSRERVCQGDEMELMGGRVDGRKIDMLREGQYITSRRCYRRNGRTPSLADDWGKPRWR